MSSKSILHQDLTWIFKISDELVGPLLGINEFIIKMKQKFQASCKWLLISANILLVFNSYNRLAACFGVTHWGNRKKDLKHLLSFDLDLFSSRSIAPCELIDVGDEISGTKTSRGRIYWFELENYKGSTHVVNVFTNFPGRWMMETDVTNNLLKRCHGSESIWINDYLFYLRFGWSVLSKNSKIQNTRVKCYI